MLDSPVEVKSFYTDDFLSAENISLADVAVAEIFKLMFSLDIRAIDKEPADLTAASPDDRTAIVGFSGAMRGSCQIRIGTPAARTIASAMLGGAPIEDDDDSINDAVGELCNMLAGGWKNEVPALSSECSLSPPTVIFGRDYKVHLGSKPSVNLSRTYQFDDHLLYLTLSREEPAASV